MSNIKKVEIYEKLKRLHKSHPNDVRIRHECASAILSLVNDDQWEQPARALKRYKELKVISETNPGDSTVLKARLIGAGNLIGSFSTASNPDIQRALQLYEEISILSENSIDNVMVRRHLAASVANLISPIGNTDLAKAQQIYQNLFELRTSYPDEKIISTWLAEAASNLINLTYENKFNIALKYYRDLAELTKQYSDVDHVIKTQSSAASMLFEKQIKSQSMTSAHKFFWDLRELANTRLDILDLRLLQLKNSGLAIISLSRDQTDMVWDIYKEVKKFTEKYSDRSDFRYFYAFTTLLLLNFFQKIDLQEVHEVYIDLKNFSSEFPEDLEVAEFTNTARLIVEKKAERILTIDDVIAWL